MKPLALNLSQMKKIAGDSKTSTFLHPGGHKMVIAHDGVSALHRKQLENMPIQKMATGGDTADKSGDIHPIDTIEQAANQGASQEAFDQSLASLPKTNPDNDPAPPDSSAPETPAAQAPSQSDQSQAPNIPGDENDDGSDQSGASAPAADPAAPPASQSTMPAPGDFQAAYNQAQSAITDKQKIDQALAKSNADIQAKDLLDRESLGKSYTDDFKTFSDHQQQFMKDYMNSHIDPKHYQENMSSGQKVGTAIGLLLGGISAGHTGVNPAMDFLNKQIDRDMRAQESRIDQQKTLLGANHELYQDGVIAKNQTRVNMNDLYDHRIQLAASKLGTPIAAQAAKAAHANLGMQNAGLLQQNAMRATVMKRLQDGGGAGLTAMDLHRAGMIPEPDAIKEQASIDSQNKALASAAEIFKKYREEQTAGNVINPQSYNRVNELNAQATNLVMESDASKRLTPESAKLEVKPFWVKTTDSEKTIQDKLEGMGNLIRQHAAPTPYMSQYAPGSLPKYKQSLQSSGNQLEGKTAVNPKTGQRIIMKGGQWVPLAK